MYIDVKEREEYAIVQKVYTKDNKLKSLDLVTNAKSYKEATDYLYGLYESASKESICLVDGLYKKIEVNKCQLYIECFEVITPGGFELFKIVEI